MLWAQAMVEYGLLDAAIAGVSNLPGRIDAALGAGATRWLLVGGAVVLIYWAFKKR